MSKKILLTKDWLSEIQEELKILKDEKRFEIAEKLKEAISYWDLSENSEYEDARNEQAQVELRIIELEEILKNYELVSSKTSDKDWQKVNIWSLVTIVNNSEQHKWEKETFKIVWTTESDIYENKISNESPIWKVLLWKTIWDIAKWKSPSWEFSFKILEIK
ncbi:MAG: Transcription elongation factor [uncultured bacterium (gcode 4)]|uniref:Transcription elongation factor GreA n=1 Tax=uncultured bacterium (gcode 4) TaxID=1234023 RepID=K2ADW4_9BACT|nr:MAG: Transcription elongation factor [uncultured bacterium (gcode 4)]